MPIWIFFACHPAEPLSAPPPAEIHERDGRLVDALGREVLLRGINARVAGLFDVSFDDGRTAVEEIPSFSGEDCRFVSEQLGHNLLRLPVNWSGIEPENDQWDDAYVDQALALAASCAEHGVFTLIDLHQDAYSKEIGEDGAPLWAIVPPPTELLEGPLDEGELAARRTSAQVLAAFGGLYANEAGVADAYAEMAAWLAGRIAGQPGVVGLELQNEPVSLGRQADLDAFHRKVGDAVRAVAPELHLAFEPDSFRNLTDQAVVGEPFPFEDASYAPHIYTDVFEDGWASGDTSQIAASVALASEEAAEHGAALLVGEFGHDPESEIGRAYIAATLDELDRARASWAFWVYEEQSQGAWGLYARPEGGETRGSLRSPIADLLARPFPEAIDGEVDSLAWDPVAGTLTLGLVGAGEQPHRIAAPARAWRSSPAATCDGEAAEVAAVSPGRLAVTCAGRTLSIGP